MSESKKNIIVGLTAIAATVCLLAMLLLFGWVPQFVEKSYVARVNLPDAGGLYAGARVWYGGVEVGDIDTIDRQAPLRPEVVISMSIDEAHDLPEGLSAYVYEPMIGGSPRLILDLPMGAQVDQPMPQDGTAVIEGRYISRLGAMVGGEGGEKLDQALVEASRVLASVRSLVTTWDVLGEQLVNITAERSPESVDAGEAEGNLYSLMARADARAAELKEVLAGADALVNDPALRKNLNQTLTNAAALTQSMAAAVPRIESKVSDTLGSIDTQIAGSLSQLTREYTQVARELNSALASYKALADDVRAGKGTTGKLVQDPALYNNLNDAVERLQSAINSFQATLETWTKDGLPVKL